MEKEQILSTINEKLTAEGIKTDSFQRTFSEYVALNLPAEGTEPDDAYWQKHVAVLKSVSGQFSHDVADTVTKQVEDFKKNYKPQTPPSDPPKNGGDDENYKTLLDRLDSLEGKFSDYERKNHSESLRDKISSLDSSLKVSNKALWRDSDTMAEIDDSDNVSTATAKAKAIYERKLRDYFGDGATPYGGTGSKSPNTPSESEIKARREAFKAKMKSQGRL